MPLDPVTRLFLTAHYSHLSSLMEVFNYSCRNSCTPIQNNCSRYIYRFLHANTTGSIAGAAEITDYTSSFRML